MTEPAPLSCIIYDLDGTLADTAPDIAAVTNRIREGLALEPLDVDHVRRFVGDGARRLLERAVYGIVEDPADRPARTIPRSGADIEELLARFLAIYEEAPVERSALYPGVEIGLRRWRAEGVAQVVLTNKPHAIACAVLAELGIADIIDVIAGRGVRDDEGNVLPPKPDPAIFQWILSEVGADPGEVWFVGDGPADVEFAKNAQIPCITILGGYGTLARLEAAGYDPALAAADFEEAMAVLKRFTRVAL